MKKIFLVLLFACLTSTAWGFSYSPWQLDLSGNGNFSNTFSISQEIDVNGNSIIFTDFTNPTSYSGYQVGTFTETSAFQFAGYESDSLAFYKAGYDFTGVFTGKGEIFSNGSKNWFEFTEGNLDFYVHALSDLKEVNYNNASNAGPDGNFMGANDPGNSSLFASWSLTGGGGELTTTFTPKGGWIDAYFEAKEIKNGYIAFNGADASEFDSNTNSNILALGWAHITTADVNEPTEPSPFAKEVYEYLNPDSQYGTVSENDRSLFTEKIVDGKKILIFDGKQTLYETHGGGMQLTTVPEPTTMLLLGFGLLGLAGVSRKRS